MVFGSQVERRSRALLLLIELVAFQPWFGGIGWVPAARREALPAAAGRLTARRSSDLRAVTAEFDAVPRALARRNVRWGRVAHSQPGGARRPTPAWSREFPRAVTPARRPRAAIEVQAA